MRRPWENPAAHHARLARRARAGDREAFVALYRSLYPPVARFLARRAGSSADAEDLVSRTFERLLEALPELDPSRGTVLGFALTVARHLAADQRRAAPPAAPVEALLSVQDGAPDPLELLEEAERLRAVARLVEGLPEGTRELLELRFGDGLRHAEIAALTGASEAAVKQRLSRALRELRAALTRPSAPVRQATP